LKSGSLSLLEPSGPVKAFNGVALPLIDASIVDWNGVVSMDQTFLGSNLGGGRFSAPVQA
jgi:hypothetical protein